MCMHGKHTAHQFYNLRASAPPHILYFAGAAIFAAAALRALAGLLKPHAPIGGVCIPGADVGSGVGVGGGVSSEVKSVDTPAHRLATALAAARAAARTAAECAACVVDGGVASHAMPPSTSGAGVRVWVCVYVCVACKTLKEEGDSACRSRKVSSMILPRAFSSAFFLFLFSHKHGATVEQHAECACKGLFQQSLAREPYTGLLRGWLVW